MHNLCTLDTYEMLTLFGVNHI